ncbi:MAG: translation elongation factor Ts [Thermodesulfovibrio sp.]|jgi:elongation factor Ts|uniref:Elongation factor Ts n=2 Tax=Thermodesulfovibrio TaxID=28261 RepID=A0A2J6WN72_9BACT|nr:MAG: elongation factor Ts [Thermodesulfovibrio aggregans]
MAITAQMVKELREKTGAGMMECKKALEASGGDFDKAIEYLRQKGLATAQKKATRDAREGIITSYIHMDKIGVMLELNCETDFVARNEEFRQLGKDIAMHIAASNPQYIKREDVPEEVINKEKEIYKAQIKGNKPPQVVEKIIEGKLEKFFEEMCLLEQPFIKEPEKKIKDLINEKIAKFGENIVVRRFVRFQVGQCE